jgi:hypothetical protein
MKAIFTFIGAILITAAVSAQAPQQIKYQAIARNPNGSVVANLTIGVRITMMNSGFFGPVPICDEYFTPTTNDYGLFNVTLGTTNPTCLQGIDWSAGPYFVQVAIDLANTSNYTVMGTTQLLSVPYALYAKTAETTNEHYVGELYGGGIIFHVYKEAGVQHGLIASLTDLSHDAYYSTDLTAISPSAKSNWDGQSNTTAIIGQTNDPLSAAAICEAYFALGPGPSGITTVFHDWYLPAIDELQLLCNQSFIMDKVLGADSFEKYSPYLSSTEYPYNGTDFFYLYFLGCQWNHSAKNYNFPGTGGPGHVRAVRKF